jgi:hypothetical protein
MRIERRAPERSIQNVRRIVRNAMAVEKIEIFTGVFALAVMAFLVPDVITKRFIGESRYREGSVSVLPFEIAPVLEVLMNPPGGIRFDRADQLGDRDCSRGLQIEMYVIPHTTRA